MKRTSFIILCCLIACCALRAQETADHVFVVMVSGGKNKLQNHERYWNDCAFLYRTLRLDYHIPKRNFTLLMSDGGDPATDMLLEGAKGFASSPVDLDGDAEPDVWTPATLQELTATLNQLALQLTEQDHLFCYLMDHGGTNDGSSSSYLWLWRSEKLEDTVLAALIGSVRAGSVNIVMGQCNSGGFIDNLAADRRVIATACRGDELSWNCQDRPYDEFVYHWTCAVARHDEQGNPVDADADGDGRVTMAEAFEYAREHDRRSETPQYFSQPHDLGSRWSFDVGVLSGIADVVTTADASAPVYSLQGLRTTVTRPGLYLRGGRKIINYR